MEAQHDDTPAKKAAASYRALSIALELFADASFVTMDGSVQYLEKTGLPTGEVLFIRMVSLNREV